MRDQAPFEAGLAAAVRAFADGALTQVDAAQVARTAARDGRRSGWGILGRAVPVPVAALVLLALLFVALLASVAPGARPGPAPQPTTPPALVLPVVEPLPPSDGEGDEALSEIDEALRTGEPLRIDTGTVVRVTGLAWAVVTRTNDRRTSGAGTWTAEGAFARDESGISGLGPGPVSGPFHLDTTSGAWDGICTAAGGDGGLRLSGSCWLAGSGTHDGLTWYRQFTWRFTGDWDFAGGVARGVIYPGGAPAR